MQRLESSWLSIAHDTYLRRGEERKSKYLFSVQLSQDLVPDVFTLQDSLLKDMLDQRR